MLVIPGTYGKDTCDGYSRRAVLRVGSSAIAGLSAATLLEKAAGAAEISDEEARYGIIARDFHWNAEPRVKIVDCQDLVVLI